MKVNITKSRKNNLVVVTDAEKNEIIEHVHEVYILPTDNLTEEGSVSVPAKIILMREIEVEVVSYSVDEDDPPVAEDIVPPPNLGG